jgi:CHRD domain-containing protein
MKLNFALLQLASIIILAVLTESSFANAELESLAELSGFSEVPQIFSEALGTATIKGNGTILNYQINVTGIEQVTGAAIHQGEETENGDIVVTLLKANASEAPHNGVLAGTITNSSLQGPLAGKGMKDFIDLINQNRTYVNINTTKFPNGELRGTIVLRGNVSVDGGTNNGSMPTTVGTNNGSMPTTMGTNNGSMPTTTS